MILVALRIVNDISYVMRINHYSYFAWQVQYLVKLEDDFCCSVYVNDVLYVIRINYEIYFAWQAQFLVKLEDESCCSAHCK